MNALMRVACLVLVTGAVAALASVLTSVMVGRETIIDGDQRIRHTFGLFLVICVVLLIPLGVAIAAVLMEYRGKIARRFWKSPITLGVFAAMLVFGIMLLGGAGSASVISAILSGLLVTVGYALCGLIPVGPASRGT